MLQDRGFTIDSFIGQLNQNAKIKNQNDNAKSKMENTKYEARNTKQINNQGSRVREVYS